MLLQYLLENLTNVEVLGKTDKEIGKIVCSAKDIKKDDVFIALNSKEISKAIENGANTVVVSQEDTTKVEDNITYIKAENINEVATQMAQVYYSYPQRKLKLIGITGTMGKTTVAFMIRDIMNASGKKIGMISSYASTYADVIEEPIEEMNAVALYSLFARMVEKGIEYVVLEVSSDMLQKELFYGAKFVVGVYTNLSNENNKYSTMEEYLNTKMKLFEMSDFNIINGDDIYAPRIIKNINTKIATYGLDNAVDLTATDIRVNPAYVEFKMYVNKMLETIKINIPGRYTVYNALAAIGVCSLFGSQMDAILLALSELRVPARTEVVDINKTFTVILDYANDSASIENLIQSAKRYTKGRVICVTGGCKDSEECKKIGEIAGKLSDFTTITTDSIKTNNIEELESGMKKTRGLYKSFDNRYQAIKFAMRIAWKSDVIVITGNINKKYNETIDKKNIFDDRSAVVKIAEEMPDKNIQ